MKPIQVGIVGCGKIFGAYAGGCGGFDFIQVVACADLDRTVAEAKAREFGIPRVCSVPELLADPAIEIVINLTIPQAHAELNRAALVAGKHVYTEKPFAISRAEAEAVLAAARQADRRVGSAPDTFLGGGLQTARQLLDSGAIGEPVAAVAFMMCGGHESWHPNPAFYYQRGGGPMLDMGPYYLTSLVNLFGPVQRVTASVKRTFPERTITSQPRAGQRIEVEVPTHYAAVLDFANHLTASLVLSFDVKAGHSLPRIEVYGTQGTLSVPDPNGFGGPVKLRAAGAAEWTEVPLSHGYTKNMRGIGVADLACALQRDRPHRASGELAFHVLDAMQACVESSERGQHIFLGSSCSRPAALPVGLAPGTLD